MKVIVQPEEGANKPPHLNENNTQIKEEQIKVASTELPNNQTSNTSSNTNVTNQKRTLDLDLTPENSRSQSLAKNDELMQESSSISQPSRANVMKNEGHVYSSSSVMSSSSSSFLPKSRQSLSSAPTTQSSKTSDTPEMERLKAQLKAKGLEVKKMLGDGNCLFRAVSTQIYGDPEWHGEIRRRVVDYMRSEKSYFAQFIVENYDQYIEKLCKDGCYANNPEIQAIAELYNRAIEVYGVSSARSSSSSTTPSSSSSLVSSSSESIKPINIFQASYTKHNAPIRLAYTNGNHYDAVIDPYEASIGVGLGLPQFKAGALEKENLRKAVKVSKVAYHKDMLLKKPKFFSDEEETEHAMEEAAISASLRDFWKQQGRRNRKRKLPDDHDQHQSKRLKSQSNSDDMNSSSSKINVETPLFSMIAENHAKLKNEKKQYPPVVEELILNGFSPEDVLRAYEISGDDFDTLLCLVLRRG